MKIFLTGGTGFIGSHFINAAHDAGHEIIAIKRESSQTRIPLMKEPNWITGDLDCDFSKYLSNCEVLVHLAAVGVSPQIASWSELFYWNVKASLELWLRAINSGVVKIIIAGTFAEYGKSGLRYKYIPSSAPLEPTYAYAASKAAESMAAIGICTEKNIKLQILRIFYAYGEGQYEKNFWPLLKIAALAGNDFPMTKGEQIRDFIPVEDVAKNFVKALSFDGVNTGEPMVTNIGSGQPQTLLEFAQYWWEKWDASGNLNIGEIPYRENEVMRFVPKV